MRVLLGCLTALLGSSLIGCDSTQMPVRPSGSHKVGYAETSFLDQERSRPLPVGLWYPATDSAIEKPKVYDRGGIGFAAERASYKPSAVPRPLVLLSHGAGGQKGNLSWLAEDLARVGFIVAAVDHWHDTTRNAQPEELVQVWHRPVDLSFVLTSLLADPAWGPRIDRDRFGAAGHSSGGYAVIALAGGIFNHEAMEAYCRSPTKGPDCDLANGVDFAAIDFSESGQSYRDQRIRAVLAMAPAVGQGIEIASLADIHIPVQVIVTADDELLAPALNAQRYANGIPGAKLSVFPRGGHFVFVSDCNWTARVITRFVTPLDVCGNRSAVDRPTVRREISDVAVTFFEEALRK